MGDPPHPNPLPPGERGPIGEIGHRYSTNRAGFSRKFLISAMNCAP